MKELASRIREARQALGLNQGEFAKLLSVSQGSISKWENDREVPSIGALISISEVTKRPLEFFVKPEIISGEKDDLVSVQIRIVGQIEAAFVQSQTRFDQEKFYLDVPLPFAGPAVGSDAYVIVGDRANKYLPDGGIALVTTSEIWNAGLSENDIVLVHRVNAEAQSELSLRRVGAGTENWLWPVTDAPSYQTPVREGFDAATQTTCKVIGIVVACYRVEPAAWRAAANS